MEALSITLYFGTVLDLLSPSNKRLQNSIDYYQKHIDKVSQDFVEDWVEPDAFLNLGVAYLKNQQYELAKEQLTKALKYYNGQSAEPNIIGLYMKIIKDIRTTP